ncbi:MAG: helix-turn-helix domain-containing protein [Rhizobium sp.]|nr:helix-turn-helix domain-containing protein [Rhizobium sp.]
MQVLKKHDILFAHKALNLAPGLSAGDRQVAGAIIDHYNKRTGQCDPSVGRLATLLGVGERTVKRATETLCNLKLFSKVSHGGKQHRASYVPNWDRFSAIVADWDRRMMSGEGPSDDGDKGPILSIEGDRNGPVKGDRNGPQTLRSNQSNKPIAPSGASGQVAFDGNSRVEEPPRQSQPTGRNRLLSVSERQPNAAQSARPKVVKSPSHLEAATEQAKRRWDADLRALGWHAHAEAIEHMTEPMMDEATFAELRRRGDGLRLLIDQLGPSLLGAAAETGRQN